MKVVAGVDIGGTNTRFGLTDEQGNCISVNSINTKDFTSFHSFAEELSKEISAMSSPYELLGTGIGAPNGNYFNGTIEHPPNLPWKGILPLAQVIQHSTGKLCVLTNDANAAALGEMLFGNARDLNDFIFITLGTGLGSGIVSNRKLIYGHDGFAAEIGHVIIKENGRSCGCGRNGCLETYASATGIKRTINEWLAGGEKSILSLADEIRSADVHIAAEAGDELAVKAFEYTGEILGLALANSVAYTSPQAIFLSGGLTNAGELLYKPTQYYFEQNLMDIYKRKIKILPSGLEENKGAILGAASLVWETVKK